MPARSSLAGEAATLPLARRGAPRRHRLGLSGPGAGAGPDARPEHAARPRARCRSCSTGSPRWASSGSISAAFVRDLPQPILRLIDLARALASDPKILLLDEITAALPADMAEKVFAMVRRWRERGHSVIFISHRMAEVSALCDRTTVLRDGVTVGVTETARGSEDRIVSLMLGTGGGQAARRAPCIAPRRAAVRRASRRRSRCRACAAATCCTTCRSACGPGEVLGVAALEGQGQDELFDCIAGVRRFDERRDPGAGQGRCALRHPGDAIRAGLVLVPANRLQALLQQRSIRENVALPMFRGLRAWGPIAHAGRAPRACSPRSPGCRSTRAPKPNCAA